MIFDGDEFLNLADEIFQNPPKDWPPFKREVLLRTCISRAYYGVYLQVRAYLLNRQNKVAVTMEALKRGDGEHASVRYFVKLIAQKYYYDSDLGDDLESELYNLRGLRNEADYSESTFDLAVLEHNAGLALNLADSILDNLKILESKC